MSNQKDKCVTAKELRKAEDDIIQMCENAKTLGEISKARLFMMNLNSNCETTLKKNMSDAKIQVEIQLEEQQKELEELRKMKAKYEALKEIFKD